MFASTPTGFRDTPLSKILCVGTLVIPIAASLLNIQYLFPLSVSPYLLPWHQWYRIVLNSTIPTDQDQAIVTAMLFYEFRVIERFLGTGKFAKYLGAVWATTAIALPIAMAAIGPVTVLKATPGSTAVLSGLMAAYWDLIPPVHSYKLDGVGTFTDKLLLLLLVPNLLFIEGGSVMKAVLGWTFGSIILKSL